MKPLRVLGVSLGSSKRDKTLEIIISGNEIQIERRGTDGSREKFREVILEANQNNSLDSIGIGGTDLYFILSSRVFPIKSSMRLIDGLEIPAVDGIGIKLTREPQMIDWMNSDDFYEKYNFTIKGKKAFVPCGIDRYPMAERLSHYCNEVIFGDIMFNLGLAIPLRKISSVKRVGRILLPIICNLPTDWFYPSGQKQVDNIPKFSKYFKDADILAGDFHYIRRYSPNDLEGKIVVTNTTTDLDIEFLKKRGVKYVVTSTPLIDGRTFGTNLIEAMIVAMLGKKKDEVHPSLGYQDYWKILEYEELQPSIRVLN